MRGIISEHFFIIIFVLWGFLINEGTNAQMPPIFTFFSDLGPKLLR